MNRIVKRAAGTDFVPDMEEWWEQETPLREAERKPQLRVYENPGYRRARSAPQGVPVSRKRRQTNVLNRALIYMTVTLLVVGMAVQIGRLSQIAAQTKRISTLTSEIRELDSEQQNLQVRLSLLQKSDRILDIAMNRLNMTYPEEGQIRVVSLSGYSTEVPAIAANGAAEGLLE